jgi:hypothetical protein
MSYLNAAMGTSNTKKFAFGGISQVALIEKALLQLAYDSEGNITGLLPAESTAKFQNIVFVKSSAGYEQVLTQPNATTLFIQQTLRFGVQSDDKVKAHQIILGMEYAALVKRNDGVWVLIGDNGEGITATEFTHNASEDDASMNFTLSGRNLGTAPIVTLSVDSLINKG